MEVKSVFCPLILCTEWQAAAALLPCAAVSLPSAPPCAAVKGRTYRTNKHPASRVYVCEVPDKARRHAHSRQQRNWCFHDFQPAPRILEAADCGLDVAMIARTGTATHTNVAASLPLSTKLSAESCGGRTRQTVSCMYKPTIPAAFVARPTDDSAYLQLGARARGAAGARGANAAEGGLIIIQSDGIGALRPAACARAATATAAAFVWTVGPERHTQRQRAGLCARVADCRMSVEWCTCGRMRANHIDGVTLLTKVISCPSFGTGMAGAPGVPVLHSMVHTMPVACVFCPPAAGGGTRAHTHDNGIVVRQRGCQVSSRCQGAGG